MSSCVSTGRPEYLSDSAAKSPTTKPESDDWDYMLRQFKQLQSSQQGKPGNSMTNSSKTKGQTIFKEVY
jgi:hypothetical protein